MVDYTKLIPGKKYILGGIKVGKFIRKSNDTLVFLNSQFGEKGENEIDMDLEDDYSLYKTKTKKGGRRNKKTRSKK